MAQKNRAQAVPTVRVVVPLSRKPKGAAREDVLQPEELERLMKAATDPKDRLIVACGALLGMRAGEIAQMERGWVSFVEGKVRVPAMTRHRWHPKTPEGARTLPYATFKFASEAIRAYFAAYERVDASESTVWRRVRKLATAAGIQRCRVYPHSLRATAATQFAAMGLSEADLCSIMGWSDIKVAQHYVKVAGVNVEAALERGKDKAWVKW